MLMIIETDKEDALHICRLLVPSPVLLRMSLLELKQNLIRPLLGLSSDCCASLLLIVSRSPQTDRSSNQFPSACA